MKLHVSVYKILNRALYISYIALPIVPLAYRLGGDTDCGGNMEILDRAPTQAARMTVAKHTPSDERDFKHYHAYMYYMYGRMDSKSVNTGRKQKMSCVCKVTRVQKRYISSSTLSFRFWPTTPLRKKTKD